MRLATSDELIAQQGLQVRGGLKAILDRGIRPAVGFLHPTDVLKDPHLTISEKREILCSWASDASSVQDEPNLRWLLGTVEPVRLDEVLDALRRLDRFSERRANFGAAHSSPPQPRSQALPIRRG